MLSSLKSSGPLLGTLTLKSLLKVPNPCAEDDKEMDQSVIIMHEQSQCFVN